ncbi:hypothetical protein ZWY2020_026415 [Hordeum vulgare]|nr:hypothetical protein ZWY2020_026415 [Hordeum vulgare]
MDTDSGMLGIWGTGGVGKSCLLKLVTDSRSEYANDSLNVMFVRAGIGCTVSQVQQAIATSMGLSIVDNETSQASIIRDHLIGTSFLLLLDDLWEYLDLVAVGIPLPLGSAVVSLQGGLAGQKQRKVMLTTRNMNLCDKMGCSHDNTIKMECLDEEDAWKLYRGYWSLFIDREFTIEEKTLLPEILPVRRLPGCITLQDDRFPGMSGSYNKVRYFIEDKGGRSLLLGVWGTRGVGKTTLLRLMRDYKDDIREPFNWWAVGLPLLSYRGQKIILATRSQAACALMGCHPADIIVMRCLGKEDAWSLFKDKVGMGIIDDHPQVHHLAKQMVSLCGGLPLALCALGGAMSNKRDPREWRSACSQLTAIGLEPWEIDDKE